MPLMIDRFHFFQCSIALGLLLLGLPTQAQQKSRAESPSANVTVLRDLVYVPDGHKRQRLDLMLPDRGDNWPLIVWVHGGGWRAGSKERCPGKPFLSRGYAVASINYRLSQHAVFPAQIEDCKAAIRWLRANASNYGYDASRIGVWGGSAGGHLAALLGTTSDTREFDVGPNLEFSSAVQAVCDVYGPTDFSKMNEQAGPHSRIDHDAPDSPESQLLGAPITEHPELVARANPITYVSTGDPPFLVVHGAKDFVVPVGQSKLLRDALGRRGLDVTLRVVPEGGHGLGNLNLARKELLALVGNFFDRNLKSGSNGTRAP